MIDVEWSLERQARRHEDRARSRRQGGGSGRRQVYDHLLIIAGAMIVVKQVVVFVGAAGAEVNDEFILDLADPSTVEGLKPLW